MTGNDDWGWLGYSADMGDDAYRVRIALGMDRKDWIEESARLEAFEERSLDHEAEGIVEPEGFIPTEEDWSVVYDLRTGYVTGDTYDPECDDTCCEDKEGWKVRYQRGRFSG